MNIFFLTVPGTDIQQQAHEWQLDRMRDLADVHVNPESAVSLGAETIGHDAIIAQLRGKTEIVTKMLAKIQLCCDTQVEYVHQRAYLGVAKINDLLRANGVDFHMESQAIK